MCHRCIFQWPTTRSWYLIRLLKTTDTLADIRFIRTCAKGLIPTGQYLNSCSFFPADRSLAPCRVNPTFVGSGGFFAASRLTLAQTAGHLSSMQASFKTWTLIKGWRMNSAARIYLTFTTERMVLPNGLPTTFFFFFFFPQRIFSGHEPPVMTWILPMRDIGGKHCELHKRQGRQLERAKFEVQLLGRSFNDSPDFTDIWAGPTCVSHCLPEGAKH